MGFDKRWAALTSGNYNDPLSWAPTSVRNSRWNWTASGSGTGEFYLRTAAGTNPAFAAAPAAVQIAGADATPGTVGTLAEGEWAFADNDTLGYSTLYVRLPGDVNPNMLATDQVAFRAVPQAGDNVRIPPGTASITAGLDQSAVALGDFIVEEGYQGDLGGDLAGYLRIDADRLEFRASAGTAFIDVGSAGVDCQVFRTGAPAASGERGLYLVGTIGVLNVVGGSVGVAVRHGEVATVTTVRLIDVKASLWIGAGCALTNWEQHDGNGRLRAGGTVANVLIYEGALLTEETVAITTLTQHGGEVTANATGTIAAYHLRGGTLDLRQSGAARAITSLHKYRGEWELLRNKEAVNIAAEVAEHSYVESGSAA